MSRTYLTFGDIAGKLHMLRIECTRCARRRQYSVAKLIAQHGHRGNMSRWVSDLRAIARSGMRLNCTNAAT
jgi:transposase-like protein